MRKIIVVEFLTLDGFVSGPGLEMDWVADIYTDEIAQALGEGQKPVDTFLQKKRKITRQKGSGML